jgi:crotonobetainyl-CoA:carnitine CoA-transferase CaiB-like acyl-CoA transferase
VNFEAICNIMERPELAKDPRFDSFLKRAKLENAAALKTEMEKWSVNYTAEEILERVLLYQGEGVVGMGRSNLPSETLAESHWWERGTFQIVDDPVYGKLLIQGQPVKMTETPPRIKWACRPVGADNDFIYGKYLGLGRERLRTLKARGVV